MRFRQRWEKQTKIENAWNTLSWEWAYLFENISKQKETTKSTTSFAWFISKKTDLLIFVIIIKNIKTIENKISIN